MTETLTNPSATIGIAPPGGHYSHAVHSDDLVLASGHCRGDSPGETRTHRANAS